MMVSKANAGPVGVLRPCSQQPLPLFDFLVHTEPMMLINPILKYLCYSVVYLSVSLRVSLYPD